MFSFCNRQFLTLDIIIPPGIVGESSGEIKMHIYIYYMYNQY